MQNSSRTRYLFLNTKWFGLAMFTLLCIFIFAPQSAFADWSSDPDVNTAVTTADGDQCRPQIIYDGSGGYFAIWRDKNTEAPGIFAQRYDANGNALWGEGGKAAYSGDHSFLEGIADGKGGVILAWDGYVDDHEYAFAQRLDADGNALWAADGIPVTDGGYPWIASDGDGGAIIMSYYGYVNRVASDGSLPWGDADSSLEYSTNSSATKIVPDGAGGAILLWTEDSDIAVTRINSSGELYGEDPLLLNGTASGSCPRLVPTGDGGAIVVWYYRDEDYTVYAQKVGGNGEIQWTEGGKSIASMSSLDSSSLGLASDGSGGAFFTWGNEDDDTLYAQYVNTSGALVWADPVPVSADGEYSDTAQHPRKTVEDGLGGFITGWYNDSYQVKAQRCDADGNVLWTDGGAVLSNGVSVNYGPRLATNGQGGAVAIWVDTRGETDKDIYIQGIDADGVLGNPGYSEEDDYGSSKPCFITAAW
jgi:hypothetical protein